MDDLVNIVMMLVPMILSLSVHEWAHAITAYKLGDSTAKNQGRLTLNPISHIDPIGTILLPSMLALSGAGFGFGWAKPVPVTPHRLTRRFRMRTAMLIVAAAGPLSNLALALIVALMMSLLGIKIAAIGGGLAIVADPTGFAKPLFGVVMLNVGLLIFNLLPVPPLDGSRVLEGLLPDRHHSRYLDFLGKYPFIVPVAFMGLIFFGGRVIGVPVVKIGLSLLELTGSLS